MNTPRQVVVATRADGAAVVSHDGRTPTRHVFTHMPGLEVDLLWATSAAPVVPVDADDGIPRPTNILPGPGETRFYVLTLPPEAVFASPSFDPAAAGTEQFNALPDFAAAFEPDAPGMHTTDTVDYIIVLEGEIELDLGDGRVSRLAPGDIVVQNGTRHAWRNHGSGQARLAAVMVGASRTDD